MTFLVPKDADEDEHEDEDKDEDEHGNDDEDEAGMVSGLPAGLLDIV